MLSACYIKPREIRFEEREKPVAGKGEALIRIRAVGLCGSDYHFYEDGAIGVNKLQSGRVLGHEACGVVEAVGEGVTSLRPGDLVAIDPGRSCGQCSYCRQGRYNMCQEALRLFLGTPFQDGTLQQYIAYPVNRLYKLPEGTDPARACLIEPFSVALHSIRRGGVQMGDRVVILGGGCIGLMALIALKQMGISQVAVADVSPSRLEIARKLGASETWNPSSERAAAYMEETGGGDCVLECSGNAISQAQAHLYAKRAGTVVYTGISGAREIPFDINACIRKELDLKTVYRFTTEYQLAAGMIGDLPLEQVVTHRYPFSKLQEALENGITNKEVMIKTVILFD